MKRYSLLQATSCRLQAKNSLKQDTGLTLMEVLVTVSILTLVFGMTFGAMRIYDISTTMANTKSYLSAQANQALNKMKEELALSSLSATIPVTAVDTDPDILIFQIPTGLDSNQNIIWGNGVTQSRWIEYMVMEDSIWGSGPGAGWQLIRIRSYVPRDTEILANDITDLQFTPTTLSPGDSLTIQVTASKTAQRGVVPGVSVTLSTRVDFRN